MTNTYVETFLGSGCGAVGRAVAFNIRDPRFESQHRKIIYLLICQLHDFEKTKIKKKGRRGLFFEKYPTRTPMKKNASTFLYSGDIFIQILRSSPNWQPFWFQQKPSEEKFFKERKSFKLIRTFFLSFKLELFYWSETVANNTRQKKLWPARCAHFPVIETLICELISSKIYFFLLHS